MKTVTVEELENSFENLISLVEKGETVLIKTDKGDALLVPYIESNYDDEIVKIYTEHEEAS